MAQIVELAPDEQATIVATVLDIWSKQPEPKNTPGYLLLVYMKEHYLERGLHYTDPDFASLLEEVLAQSQRQTVLKQNTIRTTRRNYYNQEREALRQADRDARFEKMRQSRKDIYD